MVKIVRKRTIEKFESLFKVTNLHINIKKDKKISQCQNNNNNNNYIIIIIIKIYSFNNSDHISIKFA